MLWPHSHNIGQESLENCKINIPQCWKCFQWETMRLYHFIWLPRRFWESHSKAQGLRWVWFIPGHKEIPTKVLISVFLINLRTFLLDLAQTTPGSLFFDGALDASQCNSTRTLWKFLTDLSFTAALKASPGICSYCLSPFH